MLEKNKGFFLFLDIHDMRCTKSGPADKSYGMTGGSKAGFTRVQFYLKEAHK